MAISRKRAQDYAERVLAHPRSDMAVILKRGKGGISLIYRGKVLTKCHASKVGMMQAESMAQALGVEVPRTGGFVVAHVPGGVLYRAIAISSLDLRRPEARILLEQHLEVADMQRTMAGSAAG